jgi:hypothetical protein
MFSLFMLLEEGLSQFEIEVLEQHPEHERKEWGFGNPVDIKSTNTKTENEQSSDQG